MVDAVQPVRGVGAPGAGLLGRRSLRIGTTAQQVMGPGMYTMQRDSAHGGSVLGGRLAAGQACTAIAGGAASFDPSS